MPSCEGRPDGFHHTLNGTSAQGGDDSIQDDTEDSSNEQRHVGSPHAKGRSSYDGEVEACFRTQITHDANRRLEEREVSNHGSKRSYITAPSCGIGVTSSLEWPSSNTIPGAKHLRSRVCFPPDKRPRPAQDSAPKRLRWKPRAGS